jgi:putative flippase GtrA
MGTAFKSQEILRYLFVGGCAVLIDAGGYVVLSGPLALSPSWAKRLSFMAGAIWAFFANKFFTFKQPARKWDEPFVFAAVYAAGFLANSAVHDLVFHFTARKTAAFFAATAVSTVLNFLGQKFLVFRSRVRADQS